MTDVEIHEEVLSQGIDKRTLRKVRDVLLDRAGLRGKDPKDWDEEDVKRLNEARDTIPINCVVMLANNATLNNTDVISEAREEGIEDVATASWLSDTGNYGYINNRGRLETDPKNPEKLAGNIYAFPIPDMVFKSS
jgi:hypothetical protein